MIFMDRNTMPRQNSNSPMFLMSSLAGNVARRIKPTMIRGKKKTVILKATIWAVIVVPISEPRMTYIAWFRFITPALTRPSSRRTVTLELWTRKVTIVPAKIPLSGLVVAFSRIIFRRILATLFIVSLNIEILNMNRTRPPRILQASVAVSIDDVPGFFGNWVTVIQ